MNTKTLAACIYITHRYIQSIMPSVDLSQVENPAALVEAIAACLGMGKELKP